MDRSATDVVENESPSQRILLLGDRLSCLSSISDRPDVDVAGNLTSADHGYAAAVIGVELPENPDEVKEDLNARVEECMMLARRVPSLQHIILVIGAPKFLQRMSRAARDNLIATCDSVSQTIQAEVEQRVGTYVIVTIILAGQCNDPELLAERVVDRVTQTEVADATAVVLWEEIRGDSIGDVGLNQYI
ncbi:hypothetical protein D9V28_12065 [Mycetocola zhadangensis]|uniref:SGNH/GDSL hydrolase family protein n=2 Tax=Mycetocola zhadangensis TaxID=1164595 RepID=A0A3L7IWV3_9MICO|nr:hypothetical protein D9V28_12065 [Mycetocola zhadangensis]GGE99145.1 hypothetical protein GCM10011313_22610 [Mycetocola zhadangensis]